MIESDTYRASRLIVLAVLLLTALAGVRVCGTMWQEAVLDRGFQMYDNNAHALHGVRMADELRAGAIGRFLQDVNAQTVWPPLMPLIEVPGFMAFGVGYDTAERQMVVIGFLVLLAAAAAGLALGGVRGATVAGVLVALIASSPFYASFMGEIMSEGPATLFWLVSMAFYARWVRHARTGDLVGTCLTGFALFMLKYNFGLLWAAPILLHELWRSGARPATVAALWRARPRIAPLWWVYAAGVSIAAVFLFARLLDRGWGAAGLSHAVARARTHGLAMPVLGVAGLVLLPFVLRPRATWRALGLGWHAAGPFGRAFLGLVVAPTAAWFAVPSHAKGLLHFLAGRVSEIPVWSLEGFLYYPRVFVYQYVPAAWIGVSTLVLALASIALLPRLRAAERVLPLALAIQLALVTLHPIKGDRYFYTVAFVVWTCAALTLAVLADAVAIRLRRPGGAAILGLVLLATVLATGVDPAAVRREWRVVHVPASVGRVLDAVVDVEVRSRGAVLFGTWNRLAPPLVEWHQRQRHPAAVAPPRAKNPSWFDTDQPGPLLDRIAADPEIERVIVLELRPGFPEYSTNFDLENAWQAPARARLASDPRFEREQSERFDDSGYVMTVYRRRG